MINILAYHFNGYGSIGGICKKIYLSDLQYNRPNFRDKYKNKSVSRIEYNKYVREKVQQIGFRSAVERAKNEVKENKFSEIFNLKNLLKM